MHLVQLMANAKISGRRTAKYRLCNQLFVQITCDSHKLCFTRCSMPKTYSRIRFNSWILMTSTLRVTRARPTDVQQISDTHKRIAKSYPYDVQCSLIPSFIPSFLSTCVSRTIRNIDLLWLITPISVSFFASMPTLL